MTIDEVMSVCQGVLPVSVSAAERQAVEASHRFLAGFSVDKVIYGINTGFGPMAQWRVAADDLRQLQYNIVRSHCCGSFAAGAVDRVSVRAALLCRLRCFLRGYSGVSPGVVETLERMLNSGWTPRVPWHGSVGASGDLVQLAHVALAMIGEAELLEGGRVSPALELLGRDGLALVNGTAVMTGASVVNVRLARGLVRLVERLALLVNEVVESYDDMLSATLNEARGQVGQVAVAARLRALAADSELLRKRRDDLYCGQAVAQAVAERKVQGYYSLRCVPQIVGPIHETVEHMAAVVEREVEAVDDNPVVAAADGDVLHGGNFHGDCVSLENDKLKLVMTRLAQLVERESNYLMHSLLNGLLPPFCTRGRVGLDYGMQALQFTQTSTTAECQTLAMSNYVHTVPCNADNQDIVSMGTNSALLCRRLLSNAITVVSVGLMTAAQAVDCRGCHARLSTSSRRLVERVRAVVPELVDDRRHDEELGKLEEDIHKSLLDGGNDL